MKTKKTYEVEIWTRVYSKDVTPSEFVLDYDLECIEFIGEKMTEREAVNYCTKKYQNVYNVNKKQNTLGSVLRVFVEA